MNDTIFVDSIGQVNSRGFRASKHKKGFQRINYELTKRMIEAVTEGKELLSDGQWHRTNLIYGLAIKHKVQKGNLLYQLPLAVSECSLYFCIPKDNTPDEPVRSY